MITQKISSPYCYKIIIVFPQIQVAIKCLNRERMQNPSEFLDEAAIMHTIDHEHIVRLYGVVLEPKAAMLVCNGVMINILMNPVSHLSVRSRLTFTYACYSIYEYVLICTYHVLSENASTSRSRMTN